MEKWVLGLVPVAAGLGALALPNAGAWLRYARWLAIGMVGLLIGLHLLPESVGELGVWALVPFGVGVAGPAVVERLSGIDHEHEHGEPHHLHHDHAHEHGHGSLTLGFVGLGLHQVFDGLQIGFVHEMVGPQGTLAIGLHGAPLIAAFALTCRKTAGAAYAFRRGLALVALTGVGIALAGLVPQQVLEPIEPWLSGFVAGVVLHVVLHDA